MKAPRELDRASGADLLNLALDSGPVPMQVGACLLLPANADAELLRKVLAGRVALVPRLRQRLVATPPGCGRPLWIDDPAFDVDRHLTVRPCPSSGDRTALLDLATALVAEPLPRSRPLWSMTLVTGVRGGRVGLVITFHHVLADGMGGLAVLARLLDTGPAGTAVPDRVFPRPAPSVRALAADAWRLRLRAVAHLPHAWTALRLAAREMGRPPRAARCSLNRPADPRQRMATASADLAAVRRFAHTCGGTVNDAILAAVTGALEEVLRSRGEAVPELVVQVPVSARLSAGADHPGNQVGIMPVALPVGGEPGPRLARTAAITRARKSRSPGASAELIAGANRLLAWLGVLPWLLDHQRMINTAATNLRGPDHPLALGGVTVEGILPVTLARGNVTVVFSALSYAGVLTITATADARLFRDLEVLDSALARSLAAMETAGG